MTLVSTCAFTLRDASANDAMAIQDIYAARVLTGLASFEEAPSDAPKMARRMKVIEAYSLHAHLGV